jgi:hypothetical protein
MVYTHKHLHTYTYTHIHSVHVNQHEKLKIDIDEISGGGAKIIYNFPEGHSNHKQHKIIL